MRVGGVEGAEKRTGPGAGAEEELRGDLAVFGGGEGGGSADVARWEGRFGDVGGVVVLVGGAGLVVVVFPGEVWAGFARARSGGTWWHCVLFCGFCFTCGGNAVLEYLRKVRSNSGSLLIAKSEAHVQLHWLSTDTATPR